MASEAEEYEYYAYSSDEEDYPIEQDGGDDDGDDRSQDDDGDVKMQAWGGSSDNPNAAPMSSVAVAVAVAGKCCGDSPKPQIIFGLASRCTIPTAFYVKDTLHD